MSRARSAARSAKALASPTAVRRAAVDPSMRSSHFTVNATQAKNQFGEILRRVRSSPVFIERHGSPLAVVLDVTSYEALLHKARDARQIHLDALRDEFDAMYASMQTSRSRRAVDRLSTASPEELSSATRRAKQRA